VLNSDAFWSVRAEAASALKKIANEEARTALATSLIQPSARVRKSVVEALAAFPHEVARNALWKQAGVEKNPAILAAIIQTWGARPGESEISAALRKHLSTPSFRERIASAAINALRAQDDATAAPLVMEALKTRLTDFKNRDHDNLFDSLAFLARNDKDRSPVRNFLASLLNDPRPGVRVAAVKALGTLRDPVAMALLTPLTQVQKPYQDPVREAAEKSLATLQTQLDGPMELKNVLQRLDTMQKESEKLQKELEALKKQTKPEKKK
jgi:aminopeptidase N